MTSFSFSDVGFDSVATLLERAEELPIFLSTLGANVHRVEALLAAVNAAIGGVAASGGLLRTASAEGSERVLSREASSSAETLFSSESTVLLMCLKNSDVHEQLNGTDIPGALDLTGLLGAEPGIKSTELFRSHACFITESGEVFRIRYSLAKDDRQESGGDVVMTDIANSTSNLDRETGKGCFRLMSAMLSGLILVDIHGKLHFWDWAVGSEIVPHPFTSSLGLDAANIIHLSTSSFRATIATDAQEFASWMDPEFQRTCGEHFVEGLVHSLKRMSALEGEDLAEVTVGHLSTCVRTQSRKAFWWGAMSPCHTPSQGPDLALARGELVGLLLYRITTVFIPSPSTLKQVLFPDSCWVKSLHS